MPLYKFPKETKSRQLFVSSLRFFGLSRLDESVGISKKWVNAIHSVAYVCELGNIIIVLQGRLKEFSIALELKSFLCVGI